METLKYNGESPFYRDKNTLKVSKLRKIRKLK